MSLAKIVGKTLHWAALPGLLLVLCAAALAGTVGKLTGHVTDTEAGDPVVGANVMIVGTTQGASADMNGDYYILNIPPGMVNVRVTAVGFTAQTVQGIQIISDQTTNLDFKLNTESVQAQEVVVVAERKLVERTNTFGTATVASRDIEALPVTNLSQVIDLQAGVVDGHFRGGRAGEVLYLVDGVSVTDIYDNTQGTTVDERAVEELQVISGTFNAEYGQAMSGVVNTVIKEGGQEFHGTASAEGGDYISNRTSTFRHIGAVSPSAIQDYTISVSGPVPRIARLTFNLSGRYLTDSGWLYGQRLLGMAPDVLNSSAGVIAFPSIGNGSWAEMNPDLERSGTGKLTYQVSPVIKLSYTGLFSSRIYRDYDYTWVEIPDANLRRYRDGRTNLIKLNHTLGGSMFYEVGLTSTYSEYHHYVFESATDPRYAHPAYSTVSSAQGLHLAGNNLNRFRRWTQTYGALGNFSWQVNKQHLVKFGFEVKANELHYDNIDLIAANPDQLFDPSGRPAPLIFQPAVPSDTTPGHTIYTNNPYDFSVYAQEKFEIPSLIINAGLRFDYLQPDGLVLADPKDPDVYSPVLLQHAADPLAVRKSYWYNKPSPKVQVSPRVGIAFPMSDVGVFHFAYGHFVQWPTFENLYTNPRYVLNQGVGLNTVMGNPDLNMEETVTYELGFQQQIAQDVALKTTLFARDIRNLVAADRIIETYSAGTKYAQYVNRSFGSVNGITLSFDKRYADNFSVFTDYTYQVAKGDASDPQSAYNAQHGEHPREPEKQLVPLDWDRRHTINAGVTYATTGPGDWGATLVAKYGSGLPYTPQDRGIRTGFENDGRKPEFYDLDLSAYKSFPLAAKSVQKIVLTLNVLNLLDTPNEDNVFASTGRAGYTAFPETEYHSDGRNFSRPRMVKVGLRTEF
jgi:hypothetical protein